MPQTKLEMVSNVFTQHDDKGTPWEREFVEKNLKRIEDYKERTLFSDKQKSVVDQIYDKYCKPK